MLCLCLSFIWSFGKTLSKATWAQLRKPSESSEMHTTLSKAWKTIRYHKVGERKVRAFACQVPGMQTRTRGKASRLCYSTQNDICEENTTEDFRF